MNAYPTRLIEVDLPIKRISAHARREKSIRHGHISTLHIWWARRPLAACRAVICASLWPAPTDPTCPPDFVQVARTEMLKWTQNQRLNLLGAESQARFQQVQKNPTLFDSMAELQQALFDFIADFADWSNSTKKEYLETSRTLTQAAHEALGGLPGTRPLVIDPFAGGGSIPLEALRVGADTFASDLNPVAVLINKVVLEYIPQYGQRLADEVRKWGQWIKEQAEKELAEFYPNDSDGATPIAYLWARTIICEGPMCGAKIPLMRSLWLAKKGKRKIALQLIPNKIETRDKGLFNSVDFEIVENPSSKNVTEGTIKNGDATCPCCGYTTSNDRVRAQLSQEKGGANNSRLVVVITTRQSEPGRFYRLARKSDEEAVYRASIELERRISQDPHIFPGELVPPERPSPNARGLSAVTRMGVKTFGDMFTSRQLLALTTFSKQLAQIGKHIPDETLSKAVQACLGLNLSKLADLATSLGAWEPNVQTVQHIFGRQAIPICWDFAEGNPIGSSRGSWATYLSGMVDILATWRELWRQGTVGYHTATAHPLSNDSVDLYFTDPPYYDAIPYADLSDFFYVWLKRSLKSVFPELFYENLTPKDEEAIWNPGRLLNSTGLPKDKAFYESQIAKSLKEGRRITSDARIGVIVFAHKSTAGWESVLSATLTAGWTTVASWPIDTELDTRVNAMNTASLASSIHLVCRPREDNIVGDWRDVLQELPRRIHEWLPRLAQEGIVGADAIFACLGPALEIFSRYSRVEKANGDPIPLGEYLEAVWAAVSKEALAMVFAGADTSGFEEDARLTAMWLWTLSAGILEHGTGENSSDDETESEVETEKLGDREKRNKGGYALEYDAARKIAQGLGAHLEQLSTLIQVKGSEAHLLSVRDRTKYLFGKAVLNEPEPRSRKAKQPTLFDASPDVKATDWKFQSDDDFQPGVTTLDRVHQSMLLFQSGRSDVLKRFLVDQGIGQNERFWRLAQAFSALYPPSSDEKRWVDGVLARKKGLGL